VVSFYLFILLVDVNSVNTEKYKIDIDSTNSLDCSIVSNNLKKKGLHVFNFDCQNSIDNKASITFEIRKNNPINGKNDKSKESIYETIRNEINEVSNKNDSIKIKKVNATDPKIKNYINSGLFSRDLRWNSRQLNSSSLNFNNKNVNQNYEIANKPEKVKYKQKDKANNFVNTNANKISLFKTNTNYKNIYLSQAKFANKL
jgi:hypothetical protein